MQTNFKFNYQEYMLLYKIKELECALEKDEMKNGSNLKIVSSLKSKLLQIDFKSEEIPEYSFDKIIQLLEDINGEEISIKEKLILQDIILP